MGPKGCRSGSECNLTIAFVPKASDNPVFRVAFRGAVEAAEKLSVNGFKVKMECWSPEHLNPAEQAAAVDLAIASRPSGLIVSCLDASAQSLKNAVKDGLPVMTFDSDCLDSNRMAFCGVNNKRTGEDAADHLVEAMSPKGDNRRKSVAILSGNASADNLTMREGGFNGRINSNYNERVTVVATQRCNEVGEDCGSVLENMLRPELDGLFITGLWGLQAACTCTGFSCTCDDRNRMPKWKAAANDKLKTVSYDTVPFELELMKGGYLSGLISQSYYSWGYESVSHVFKHITQGPQATTFIDSGGAYVDPINMDAWLRDWREKDFDEGVLSDCVRP